MNENDSKELLYQVRVAHRLLASYYQRVHQLIHEATDKLSLEYLFWEPTDFDYAKNRNSKVLDFWSWCLLPGQGTSYAFINSSGDKLSHEGDCMIVISIINDTAIDSDKMEDDLKISKCPEDSVSVLRCYLVASQEEFGSDWFNDVWSCIPWPKITSEPVK